jgi:hypothetical protein
MQQIIFFFVNREKNLVRRKSVTQPTWEKNRAGCLVVRELEKIGECSLDLIIKPSWTH